MLITNNSEIEFLMPTARWEDPYQLFGYLEEEEMVVLEPLLGEALYQFVLAEYDRLRQKYWDITKVIGGNDGKMLTASNEHTDVTEEQDRRNAGNYVRNTSRTQANEEAVDEKDYKTIQLIRICQRIEFYKMLSHKAGLLTVSFNAGGGMNLVSADGYEPASDKDREEARKDAFMSAGRAVDSLLLFLESDAKGEKLFTELWQQADAFYLHKDLLFQTAHVLNQFLDINNERWAYVKLVRDIRFCQNTYLKPRIGSKLLMAVVDFLNEGQGESIPLSELANLLRTALAFYVESRRQDLAPAREKLARRDSMTDAQQAMAMACAYIEDNLNELGEAAVGSPIYNAVRARERQEEYDRKHQEEAQERRRRAACQQQHKKLFTAFPHTTRQVDVKD